MILPLLAITGWLAAAFFVWGAWRFSPRRRFVLMVLMLIIMCVAIFGAMDWMLHCIPESRLGGDAQRKVLVIYVLPAPGASVQDPLKQMHVVFLRGESFAKHAVERTGIIRMAVGEYRSFPHINMMLVRWRGVGPNGWGSKQEARAGIPEGGLDGRCQLWI